MKNVSRWRDSGHLERAVESAGGQDAFDNALANMLDEAQGGQLAQIRERCGPAAPADHDYENSAADKLRILHDHGLAPDRGPFPTEGV